jgi:L-aspartate oxidase
VLRDEAGIREGIHRLAEVESELHEAVPSDINERKMELDLKSAVLVLKAILSASLERKESRGGFQREDFPETDDGNWKKNSCLTYDPEGNAFTSSHHSVV